MEAKATLGSVFMLFSGKKPEMDGKSFNKCMKDSKLMGKVFIWSNSRQETHQDGL